MVCYVEPRVFVNLSEIRVNLADLPFADKPVFLQNAYRSHFGGFRAVRDAAFVSVDITLDVLNGCDHKCPGCFVQRKNDFMDRDLKQIEHVIDEMIAADYDLNELFIGPTDIFSAINFKELISNPTFKRMSQHFTLTATSTLLNDTAQIHERLEFFRKELPHRDRDTELFIVLDLERYFKKDWFYINQMHRNIKLLSDWNVFFIVNVYSEDMFDEINLTDLGRRLKRDFGTKLRINPSYFRGTNKKHLERYATLHKNMLEKQISEDNINEVFLNMTDIHFSSYTLLAYCYSGGKLSVMPFIYEAIPQDNPMFDVVKDGSKYELTDIEQTHHRLAVGQYEYAQHTESCNTCEFLASCVGRNVLAYMESRRITKCLLPTALFRDASRAIELLEIRQLPETKS